MSTDARREQLLRIGAQLFAEKPYDEVWVSEVADRAGVSRGLLYHYFPTKQDFAIAITQAACGHMFATTRPDPTLPVDQQLREVLNTYLRFAEEHEDAYRAMHRGLIANPQVRALRKRDLAEHERRVLAAFATEPEPPELLRVAVRGWLAFVIAANLDWLDHRSVSREEILDLCVHNLLDLVAAATLSRMQIKGHRP